MFYYFLPTSCDWLRLFKENNKIDKNKKTKQNKQKVIAERKFEMWETKLKQVIIELKNKKMPKKKKQKVFLKKLSGYFALSYFHKWRCLESSPFSKSFLKVLTHSSLRLSSNLGKLRKRRASHESAGTGTQGTAPWSAHQTLHSGPWT